MDVDVHLNVHSIESKAPMIESIPIQCMHVYSWTYPLYTMVPDTGSREYVEACFYALISLDGLG